MKIPAALKKEYMRVPLWIWLVLLAVATIIIVRMRQANAGEAEEDDLQSEFDDDEAVLPVMPVEGVDNPPMTGGGAPPKYPVPVIIIPSNPCARLKCPKGYKKVRTGSAYAADPGKCKCVKRTGGKKTTRPKKRTPQQRRRRRRRRRRRERQK